jgi:RND family efflux transporter MFP subunit
MNSVKIRLIILMITGLFFLNLCDRPKAVQDTQKERIYPVRVEKVTSGNIEKKIAYLGNLEAYQEVKVYSTIPTRITEMNVDINDRVKAGDVLAVVDNIKIRQGVLQAEAGLQSAQAQYENILTEWKRIKKLYSENAVSQSQNDGINAQKEAAAAAVNQMKAGLKSAKEQLNDSYIKSPITGIVSSRTYNIGDQTSPQMPVFTIVQMDKIKINIDIVESQIDQIAVGQKAYVTVDTYLGEMFTGKVNTIYPTINPVTRTVKCEIVIENSDYRLKPGGFARVEIVVEQHNDVLLIPKHAIIEKTSLEYLGGEITHTRIKTEKYVFIVNSAIAEMREIGTDITSDNYAEVTSGLKSGDLVITIGQYDLSDSSLVEIVEEEGAQ